MLFVISGVQIQLPVDDVTHRRDLPRALGGHGLGIERGQVVRNQLVENLLPIGEEAVEGRIGHAGPVSDGTGGHRLDAPLVDECFRRVEDRATVWRLRSWTGWRRWGALVVIDGDPVTPR